MQTTRVFLDDINKTWAKLEIDTGMILSGIYYDKSYWSSIELALEYWRKIGALKKCK